MKNVPPALLVILMLPACSATFNGTMLEDERPADRKYVSVEYGKGAPTAVRVLVDNRAYDFRVKISEKHPRIFVEATQATADATSNMTMGFVQGRRDIRPYEEAANRHLLATGRRGCRLTSSAQFQRMGYEWNFVCHQSTIPGQKQR